jgi:acetyl-CoA carboxylase biotin carboxyl carrier protein
MTMIEITASMGAKVIDVKVKTGDTVNKGDEVVILEAMKMEMPVVAVESGIIKEVKCDKGDIVENKSILVILE